RSPPERHRLRPRPYKKIDKEPTRGTASLRPAQTLAARTRQRARKVGAQNFARPGAGERPRRCSRRKLNARPQEVQAAQPALAGARQ
ncbi:Hypothetical predicted protein, partial [Marmota monax]